MLYSHPIDHFNPTVFDLTTHEFSGISLLSGLVYVLHRTASHLSEWRIDPSRIKDVHWTIPATPHELGPVAWPYKSPWTGLTPSSSGPAQSTREPEETRTRKSGYSAGEASEASRDKRRPNAPSTAAKRASLCRCKLLDRLFCSRHSVLEVVHSFTTRKEEDLFSALCAHYGPLPSPAGSTSPPREMYDMTARLVLFIAIRLMNTS